MNPIFQREIKKFNSVSIFKTHCKDINFFNSDNSSASFLNSQFFSNCIQKNFENKKNMLNSLAKFRFFDPDCFLDKNNLWKIVNQDFVKSFDIDNTSLVDVKHVLNKNKIFDFEIGVSWRKSAFKMKTFEIDLIDIDKEKFELSLHKIKYSSNFYISNYSIENEKISWVAKNNKLFKNFCFKLKITFVFFQNIFCNENLFFQFSNNACNRNNMLSIEKTKKNKKKIKLPCSDYECWVDQKKYSEKDIVFYNNEYYKCLISSHENINNSKYWQKLSNFDSFSSLDSFLESTEGKKSLSCFHSYLNFFIDKMLGDIVYLTFFKDVEIDLNFTFIFKNKKYRVVEIDRILKSTKIVLKIKAIQCLTLDVINFDNLNDSLKKDKIDIFCDFLKEDKFLSIISYIKNNNEFNYSYKVGVQNEL